MRGMIESPSMQLSIKPHGDTEAKPGLPRSRNVFPQFGTKWLLQLHTPPATHNSWLTLNHRDNLADSRHHGNCSPTYPPSHPAQPTPHPHLFDQSCHFHSFARPFPREGQQQIPDCCPSQTKIKNVLKEENNRHRTLTPPLPSAPTPTTSLEREKKKQKTPVLDEEGGRGGFQEGGRVQV